jgi:hypothetical protein
LAIFLKKAKRKQVAHQAKAFDSKRFGELISNNCPKYCQPQEMMERRLKVCFIYIRKFFSRRIFFSSIFFSGMLCLYDLG